MNRQFFICSVILLGVFAGIEAQVVHTTKIKEFKPPRINVNVVVVKDPVTTELDLSPIVDHYTPDGSSLKGCDINQARLTLPTEEEKKNNRELAYEPSRLVWPRSLNRRIMNMWFKFNDSTFYLYRTDKMSPIYITKFSRVGEQRDFWKIGTVIEGQDNIIITRDKVESSGPNSVNTSVSYIYVPPNIIVYHEMDEHGNTFKTKEYTADQDLRVIDFVGVNKIIYIISPERMFKYSVNKDSLRKEEEISNFKDNTFKQIGITQGKVFLYVKRVADGEMLYASSQFTEKENEFGYQHLAGRRITIRNSGNQNYVIYVVDKKGDGKYYTIRNPGVTKAISLVFEPLAGINRWYPNAVDFKDRIHFYDELEHVLYLKGTKKGILSFSTTQPILGIVYSSVNQFLEQDKVLLMTDERNKQTGSVTLAPIVLRKPNVVCLNDNNPLTTYLRFTVATIKNRYKFAAKINGRGGAKYIQPTWYTICWCFAIAFAVVIISYCCMKKVETERIAEKVGVELGKVEQIQEDDHNEDTKLDKTAMHPSSEEDSDDDMNIIL